MSSSHDAGARVRLAKALNTSIEAVDKGENELAITLRDAATCTVENAPVQVGSIHIIVRNLRFDGRKPHKNSILIGPCGMWAAPA